MSRIVRLASLTTVLVLVACEHPLPPPGTRVPPAPALASIVDPSAGVLPHLVFGAPPFPHGRTTTLRMSLPIAALEGEETSHGFDVTIRGALSLDRAAPIAAANPSVERSAILNRGDHAVLSVRFVPSRRTPLFRVEAVGAALAVTIGR